MPARSSITRRRSRSRRRTRPLAERGQSMHERLRARLECRTGTGSAAARGMPATPARPCHLAWQDARQALRRAHLSAHRRSAQAHPPAIADAPRQAPGDTPRPVPHRSRDVALSGHAIGTGAAMPTPQATPVSCLPSSTAIYTSLATCRRANDNHTGCSLSSAERIGDLDAAIVLAVAEIFGQDLRAAHRAGCLDDRGVPV